MIVVGFDPGAWVGYAVLDVRTSKPEVLHAGKVRGDAGVDGRELLDHALGVLPPPSLVAVEQVQVIYPRKGFGTHMATALANATRIEGRLLEAARNKGWTTSNCTARDWRQALTGLPAPSDAVVKSVLGRRVTGMGKLSAHARDAIGVALYCATRLKLQASFVGAKRSGAGA